jgi:hypothetical protein
VSESIRAFIIIILALVLMGTSGIFFMSLIYRRAVKDLFMIFREAKAFSPETARFVDELGIKGRSLLSFSVMRDYRPQILQMLIKENIVHMTEEGKLFLSEQTLAKHQISSLDR